MNFKKPPAHLSAESKIWWRRIFREYEMDESGSVMLQIALECKDRISEARALIEAEGLVIEDLLTKQRRPHPAVRIEEEGTPRITGGLEGTPL